MPLYTYHNTETNEYRDILQTMNEPHVYNGEFGDEDCWVRVFHSPNAAIDSKIDPFSGNDFVRKSYSKKGTMGDLMDRSAELSQQRAEIAGGVDPVKEKYFQDYSAARGGKKHIEQNRNYESDNVKIEL